MTEADFERAEGKALELLGWCGIKKPPVDPFEICDRLGVQVSFVVFKEEYNNISGYFSINNEEYRIYVNQDEIPKRRQFTVAHELGHYILHRKWLESSAYKVLHRVTSMETVDHKEQEANAFAAHLLVPKYMLDTYRKVATLNNLATIFFVSNQVITFQLKRTS